MELQGTVKKIFDIQTFPTGFQKREMILMTQEQYPQPISIEFLSEKMHLLDNIAEGENVKIGINIRGREWTNPQGEVKYFNSISGWRLEKIFDNAASEPVAAAPQTTQTSDIPQTSETSTQNENPFTEEGEDDGLPF
ncbi:MAG: DUF3127 domain-containing protein [Flavobacteriaceae bacterium]|jgi:hypothetical protein|nr:DUF3127 domain-containing protein [Flavobacteriaceae bacterium]